MKILVGISGYRPLHRMTHWSLAQLLNCPEPKFVETSQKAIAGPDVWRSILASDLLKLQFDAIFYLDDDIYFDPKDAVKLAGYLNQGKKIIGAMYVIKSKQSAPASRLFEGQEIEFRVEAKPVKIQYLAGGFMVVAREVFERMAKKLDFCNANEYGFYPFFMPFVKKKLFGLKSDSAEYLTEDYAFCERARGLGYDIWLDPSIRLGHIGSKFYELESIFANGDEKMDKVVLKREIRV